jgi:hypothetical protein
MYLSASCFVRNPPDIQSCTALTITACQSRVSGTASAVNSIALAKSIVDPPVVSLTGERQPRYRKPRTNRNLGECFKCLVRSKLRLPKFALIGISAERCSRAEQDAEFRFIPGQMEGHGYFVQESE